MRVRLYQKRPRRGRLRCRIAVCFLVAQLALRADAGPLLAAGEAPAGEAPTETSGRDTGAPAIDTTHRWSLSVPLFRNSDRSGAGLRLSDRLELQGSVVGSIEDRDTAMGDPDHDYRLSGQSVSIRLGLLWNIHRSGSLSFWLGPEAGFTDVDLVGDPVNPGHLDPGDLERREWFALLYGGVELSLFKGLSAITSLRTPAVAHRRMKQTGIFAQFSEVAPSIEIARDVDLSLRPELALRVRF